MFDWKGLADLEKESSVAVVMVDARGIITRVNREFELLFGWTAAEAQGLPLTTIIPESMREAHLKGFARLLATGEPRFLGQPLRLPAVDKNGRNFIAEHLILGEKRADGWAFGAAIREVLPRVAEE